MTSKLLWRAHWKDLESYSPWLYRENGQNLDINSNWSVENKRTKITTKKPVYHRYLRTEPLQDENVSLSVYKEWRKVRDVFLLYSLDHFCILGVWVKNFVCKFAQLLPNQVAKTQLRTLVYNNCSLTCVQDALNLLYRTNGLDECVGRLQLTQATALLVRDIKYHRMHKMLWYDHSNVTLSAILSPGTIFSWVVSLD